MPGNINAHAPATDSWHDSLPFSIPQRRRKQRLMRESTIYKRHAARHAQNAHLQNDPRGKVLRVLSLLPVTNQLVAPYDPKLHGSKADPSKTTTIQPSLSHYFDADSNVISFGSNATTTTSPQTTLSLMSSVCLTGISAMSAHFLWSKPFAQATSPFARSTANASASCLTPSSVVLTSTGDLKVLRSLPAFQHSQVRFSVPYMSHASAIALGLPFLVRAQLEPGAMANVVAGLISGCAITAAQRLSAAQGVRNVLMASAVSSPSPVSHVALAVASLSLYDAAAPNGIWATGLAGAAAGALTGMVRQSLASIPRQSMMHATFFVIYRSLYQSVLPSTHTAA